ncbi:uncharacterized protein TNIN_53611 [Trichonephila inaurata madagascariensis]|uniref:Uncharacterized protein n=1 Tax=Trichonephila inaurata madagascariensis TaxID=2747483 RepID=A0A8X6YWF5_9ARAC|nr:uncharacterized protein TNIN_53611 [Trichonephila inaurata madagascariensis]
MYNKKFIIGLTSDVPSTRILKPPGGGSSDLFGLKSRQDSLLQSINLPSSNSNYLLRQDPVQMNGSPSETSLRKNDSLSTIKSFPGKTQSIKNLELLSLKVSPRSSDMSLGTFKAPESKSSKISIEKAISEVILDENKCSRSKVENKDSKQETITTQKDLQTSQTGAAETNPDNKPVDKKKEDNDSRNKEISRDPSLDSITTKKSSPNQNSEILSESGKKNTPEKKFIRNPITGNLTEIRNCRKSNSALLSMSSVKEDIKSKTSKSTKSSSNIFSFEPVKTSSKAYTPRNPITGEGVKSDYYTSNDSRHKIRVIHPPGGSTYGIF